MMCGSTMGVWGGLSFYTWQPRNQQRSSYLRSPRFTPEKSRLGEEKCEFEKQGAKYILNICAVTMHQILNGVVRWFGNSRPMARRAHVCPGRERERPSFRSGQAARPTSRFPCCVLHICYFDICHETQTTDKYK